MSSGGAGSVRAATGWLARAAGRDWLWLVLLVGGFMAIYWAPLGGLRADSKLGSAGLESVLMLQEYAREHVLLCLVPAMFIAGGVSVFISQGSVIRYLGPEAPKAVAYGVAAVSGTVLAACSCTILPLFAGLYMRGSGIGPAAAFLYSGPAINVLAIVLTARVLGWPMGLARAVAAVVFAVLIGIGMHLVFRSGQRGGSDVAGDLDDERVRPLWQTPLLFAAMVGILVFANWRSLDSASGWSRAISAHKWTIVVSLLVGLVVMARVWFSGAEVREWFASTWIFAKQILPLLAVGVLIAGALLGRSGQSGLIPSGWIADAVGGNGIGATLFASVAGALMYFATLTEVPILEGLLGAGMGRGPGLALLLAGPALSLPNMLVIRSVIGTRKTLMYILLVVVLSTVAGVVFGMFG